MKNVLGFLGDDFAAQGVVMQTLVEALADRGYRLATVIEGYEPDGRSFVPYMAPREEVVVTRQRWALTHRVQVGGYPELESIVSRLAPADLVVVHGFQWEQDIPRVLVLKGQLETNYSPEPDKRVIAYVSEWAFNRRGRPVFGLDGLGGFPEFVEKHFKLSRTL